MPAALAPDLKTQALSLMAGGLTSWQAARKLNVNPSTIRNWERDSGVKEIRKVVTSAVEVAVNRTIDRRTSQMVREKLSATLASQVNVLSEHPAVCVEELKNNPERQGLAAVTKTLAETASLVFGWDKTASSGALAGVDTIIDIDEIPQAEALADQSSIPEHPNL